MITAESLADALVDAHPDRDPADVAGDELARWLAALGADPSDADLLAAVAAAWEARMM